MQVTSCIFDAYGTLFDVSAAARRAAQDPAYPKLAEHWTKLAEHWRHKQLQYTWLRAITGQYTDFWTVTKDGLDWALEKTDLAGDIALRERLLKLYWELEAYEEVPSMLSSLKSAGLRTAILSNGAPEMLEAAIANAGIGAHLDAVLSVEDVGIFKPAPQVYDMVQTQFGGTRADVLFVSSNGWDAASAAAYGFRAVWVNRASDPLDRLPGQPQHILTNLTTLPQLTGIS